MASKDIEFRVGVIILIGLLAMAGALSAGDKVTVSGVDKGKVTTLARNEQKLDETADNILSSSGTLKTMLADIKINPRKYINLKVELF